MDEQSRNYNLIIKNGTATAPICIWTQYDLIQKYKDALLSKDKLLVWETGVISMADIAGVFI